MTARYLEDFAVGQTYGSGRLNDRGVVKVKTTTLNQRGEAVQVSVGNLFVPRRPATRE
ncbi:MAG TPA: hypothetical protein VNP36_10765 [Burkholderiales bacterium]|nr:hypothetical protein [Burkholderiales bacterium]